MAKSAKLALTADDERVSAIKLAKHSWPGTSTLILMAPSKNVPAGKLLAEPALGVYSHGDGVVPLFTMVQATPPTGVTLQSAPTVMLESGFVPPTHLKTRLVLDEPPEVKSLTTSRSPTACMLLNLPAFGPVVMMSTGF